MQGCAFCFRGDPGGFVLEGAQARYLPDRPFRIRHIALELEADFDKKTITGKAKLDLSIQVPTDRLRLDQRELEVTEAALIHEGEARPCAVEMSDDHLTVLTPSALIAGQDCRLVITYSARPRWGLRFTSPDAHRPDKRPQLWSLNQDENARYWLPCLDFPDERSSFEVALTLPAAFDVFANGQRLGDEAVGEDRHRVRWRFDEPLPPYLMTLVAGEFTVLEDAWNEVPVRYVAPKGREEEARRNLDKTPRMVAFFSEWTGVPFPWERYDQILVDDYLFGGMEHTTQTTLTERMLRDERALLDSHGEGLIAHELAHQWFGDLVTCRDWSQGWLNEGFATFCEVLWTEHEHGVDEARYRMLKTLEGYLQEAGGDYTRAIVERRVHSPIDLFDGHLYNKGAAVLNMLRLRLGAEPFRAAVGRYLKAHARGSVETHDLRRAIEAETQLNVDELFDQWVFRPGHVKLEAKSRWDGERQVLILDLEQKQKEAWGAFAVDLDVALKVGEDWRVERRSLRQRAERWVIACAEEPEVVSLDPEGALIGAWKSWDPGERALRRQLKGDRAALGRVRAARALGRSGSYAAIEALESALTEDGFWGVAAEAAAALAKIGGSEARDALIRALPLMAEPRARRALVKALGSFFQDDAAAEALQVILQGDASYFVEAEAAEALGAVGRPGDAAALEALLESRDSWHDVVRAGALRGLGRLGGAERFEALLAWTRPVYGMDPRLGACAALKRLARRGDSGLRRRILDVFEGLIDDGAHRVQRFAVAALGDLGSRASRGLIEALLARTADGWLRRVCREALASLGRSGSSGEKLGGVEQGLAEQRRLTAELRRRLDLAEGELAQLREDQRREP